MSASGPGGRGCLTHTHPGQTPPVHAGIHPLLCPVHDGIRSTSGRYAFHWNVFLSNLVNDSIFKYVCF